MQKPLAAPAISNYIRYLGSIHYRSLSDAYTYDDQTYHLLDEIFCLLDQIEPGSENGVRSLWLTASRGPIEDFGDYEELLAEGEVSNREEFESWWLDEFPDDRVWYYFSAVEDKTIGYRAIFVGNHFVIEQDLRKEKNFPHDISDFTQWILDGVRECIDALRSGTYNDMVRKNLPAKHRTGTITRKELWDIFPMARADFFSDISKEDVAEFLSCMESQTGNNSSPEGRLEAMTANGFYRFCSLGYAANHYEGATLSPREQYYKHADGRDDDLGKIDSESPDAFHSWYYDRTRHGGHPWEVCRGGNSTHIDLFVCHDDGGYYLEVAGSAWSRTIEAVKFYLALHRANLPVWMRDGAILADRLTEREVIGIVPEGVVPAYCHSYFSDERIIDFMNLPTENTELVAQHCVWQDIPEVNLKVKPTT